MSRARARLASLVALLLVACIGPDPGVEPVTIASLEVFAERVEPHLEQRCGSGGCHGRPERPLSLYAPGAYRADPARMHLEEPLTGWEIEQNALRIAAFALGASGPSSIAVRKPLAVGAGGLWHGGGDVFGDATDPACRALSAWLDARPSNRDAGAP